MENIKTFILFALPFLIFYYVFNKFGLKLLKKIRYLNQLKKHGKITTGTIVDYDVDTDPDGTKSYLPIVTYKAYDKEFKILLPHPLKEKPILGSSVTVYFDDQNPEAAIIYIQQAIFRSYLGLFFLIFIMGLVVFFSIKSIF